MKALVCLSAPVFLEVSGGPANVIFFAYVAAKDPGYGQVVNSCFRSTTYRLLTTQRPQIPSKPVHAEYITGRLPAPEVLYERKALKVEKDVMGTISGWVGGRPLS
jgi:hypothetical protein